MINKIDKMILKSGGNWTYIQSNYKKITLPINSDNNDTFTYSDEGCQLSINNSIVEIDRAMCSYFFNKTYKMTLEKYKDLVKVIFEIKNKMKANNISFNNIKNNFIEKVQYRFNDEFKFYEDAIEFEYYDKDDEIVREKLQLNEEIINSIREFHKVENKEIYEAKLKVLDGLLEVIKDNDLMWFFER